MSSDNSKVEAQISKDSNPAPAGQQPPVGAKKGTKEMSKAERRELQERQRAEKEARKAQGLPHPKKTTQSQPKSDPKQAASANNVSAFNFASLFSHLKNIEDKKELSNVHSSVENIINTLSFNSTIDSNSFCITIFETLKTLIKEYQLADQAILNRDLPIYLASQLNHIKSVYPFTAGISNALNHITKYIVNLDPRSSLSEVTPGINKRLEDFQLDKIDSAIESIVIHLAKEVIDNDVILTYGHSLAVQKALELALTNGTKFSVIIVENDQQSGKILLDYLTKKGVQCSYVALSGLSYVIQDATRVWLNSESLLIDGTILSVSGTNQVALTSQLQEIPTTFFGESYKIWDKVLFNSTQWNLLSNQSSDNGFSTIQLKYDLTPSSLVSRIITESGETSSDKFASLLSQVQA